RPRTGPRIGRPTGPYPVRRVLPSVARMTSDQHPVYDLGQRWAAAEQAGDVATLGALATDDFTLVGPLGFVLDKKQWLDRYRSGDFVTTALSWHDVQVRDYGDAAVAVGVHTQEAAYRGQANNGSFRATHV